MLRHYGHEPCVGPAFWEGNHAYKALKQKVSLEDYLALREEKPYREYLYGEMVEKAAPNEQLPDVAWFLSVPQTVDGNAVSPPVLAVEILSPDDRFSRVQQKIQVYLQAGVKVVWVVDADMLSVAIYRPAQAPVVLEGEAILEDPELSGLRLPLSVVFEDVRFA